MQREIKFRIWDIRLKLFLPIENSDKFSLQYFINRSKEYIIQQFTGLKDKNGREIYEGDIIKYDRTNYLIKNGIYTTGDENFNGDYLFIENGGVMDYGISLPNINRKDIKIIGNIFESTDLLK